MANVNNVADGLADQVNAAVSPPSGGNGTDSLTMRGLAEQSGITWDFVKAHPEIFKLFKRAIKEDWLASEQGKANFQSALEESAWYTQNSSFARTYLFAQGRGGADLADQQRAASAAVQAEAVRIGARLDDKALAFFTEQYLMNGWYDAGRKQFLTQALTGQYEYADSKGRVQSFTTDFLSYEKGGASALITQLRAAADANGVTFSDGYYQSAARAVVAGLGSAEDYMAEIRGKAATLYPLFGDRIMAGENIEDIASPYKAIMAKVLELDPASISLDDAWMKQAIGSVDDKGKPAAMGLWDFEKALVRDDRYQYTKQAHEKVMGLTGEIVSMFGYGG